MMYLGGTSCAHLPPPGLSRLESARAAVQTGTADADAHAFAGFHELLTTGDIAQARSLFNLALSQSNNNAWAHFGHLTLSRLQADWLPALSAALEVCTHAPGHPLCVVASQLTFELAGQSAQSDTLLQTRLPRLLSHGTLGAEAAFNARRALAKIASLRHQPLEKKRWLLEAGIATESTLLGPFSPWHVLDFKSPTPPEQTGTISARYDTPNGPIEPRSVSAASERFSLAFEPNLGDVYLYGVDALVPALGDYLVRVETGCDFSLSIDGATVAERITSQAPSSMVHSVAARLDAGQHRLLLRVSKGRSSGQVSLAMFGASGVTTGISMTSSTGQYQLLKQPVASANNPLLDSADKVRKALESEAGEALAAVIAAEYALPFDTNGARLQLTQATQWSQSGWVLMVRAFLERLDFEATPALATGRAQRDLEAALTKSPQLLLARMSQARFMLDENRPLDALDILKGAPMPKPPPAYLALWARAAWQAQQDPLAIALAKRALAAWPGLCPAVETLYEIARRNDVFAETQTLIGALENCPGGQSQRAQFLLSRGQLEEAAAAFERVVAETEGGESSLPQLVNVLLSLRRESKAIEVLVAHLKRVPRQAQWMRLLADAYEHFGQNADALSTRQRALALDGSDLTLQRQVSRATTGKEPLADLAISTKQALDNYRATPVEERSASALVLDAAAVRVMPDGTQIERIHEIQKVLDQSGIQGVAEVNIPDGAQMLQLRTLKADGSILEPERIDGKDSISLLGVQVGDMVETEYLRVIPTRGAQSPGFVAGNFYFQVIDEPNHWSTYAVAAPKGMGLTVDAHQLKTALPTTVGNEEIFRHDERRVPPFSREPNAPPSGNEWLPFVSVGAQTRGNDAAVKRFADDTALATQHSSDIATFARNAAEGTTGRTAVERVYAAVMKTILGAEMSLATTAKVTLAERRGSRLALMVASLRALNIDVRLAAVRTFQADPSAYVFPNEQLLPYLCAVVMLQGEQPVWVDPSTRFAPFAMLPEFAAGGREAYLLPDSDHPLKPVRTPPSQPVAGREFAFQLTLSNTGAVQGTGTERYSGHEAAVLAETLDALPKDQRDLALQGAFARYFNGAELSDVKINMQREVGGTVELQYTFASAHFARGDEHGGLIFSAPTPPSMLGRRLVSVSNRVSPLYIDATERTHAVVSITVPNGLTLSNPVASATREGPGGARHQRSETQSGNQLRIEDTLLVPQGRLSPKEYQPFVPFAGDVDLLQQREMLLQRVLSNTKPL